MGNSRKSTIFGAVTLLALGAATPAWGQATRTWVSGVGDDVNPCSRTAPCKTFAGAISKTAAGGEINCLDSGGFGSVTITKSISIICHGVIGGVLATGTNGIIVNAAATDTVVLSGLDIHGGGTGLNGIRFIAGGALHVENTTIQRFNGANAYGIAFQPGTAAQLYLNNVTVSNNGVSGAGGGVLIQPTGAGGSARVTAENLRVQGNATVGMRVSTSTNTSTAETVVAIRRSQFAGSPIGLSAIMAAGSPQTSVLISDSIVAHNTSSGLLASGAGSAVIRVGGTVITGNGTAVVSSGGGQVRSYGDNLVDGNTNPGNYGPAAPKT